MTAGPNESDETLANLLHEQRRFPPEAGFSDQANATSSDYDEADGDRLAFWSRSSSMTFSTFGSSVVSISGLKLKLR